MKESKHVVAFRKRHLKQGENIVAWGKGYIGEMMGKGDDAQENGVLLISGERVAFYRKGLLGEVIETIPLKAITSIERKSLLGHRTIRIHTSHDALEFKTFDKATEQALVQAIENGRSSTAANPPQATNSLEMLHKLAELRAAGVITEDEFQSKKAALLARA